jgi:hypothetical protein
VVSASGGLVQRDLSPCREHEVARPSARRFHARRSSAAAGLIGVALAADVQAEEGIRFDYRAPLECPSAAAFEERVRQRSLHVRAAAQGELARTFDVAVVVTGEAASARVEFVDEDGSHVSRTVVGATCDEVVSSIALVVALAIDARATLGSGEAAPSAPPRPSPDVRELPPPRNEPSSNGGRSVAPVPRPTRGERPLVSAPRAWAPTVGLGAGFASHEGPSGALTLDAFFAARPFSQRSSVRASLFHFRSGVTTRSGQEAIFRGYGLRAEACPWALLVRRFFAEPCAGVDLGVIQARGIAGASVVNQRSSTRFWWQAEAMSRLGVQLGPVVLEVQGELAVPLFSYEFGFGPETRGVSAFQMPPVGVAARTGAGVRF